MNTKGTCSECKRKEYLTIFQSGRLTAKEVCYRCKVDLIRNNGRFISKWANQQ